MASVTVVGAGVIGLSCAVRLAEAGHEVRVLARERPEETTSAVAAALWYPYLAFPAERVTAWSTTAYREFARLSETAGPAAGISVRAGTELLRERQPDPWWKPAVPDFARLADPPPGYEDGWRFAAPVIDMAVYLPWLRARLEELGGGLGHAELTRLPADPLVVDCAGLGARELAADPSVAPVRGQVIVLEQVGLDEWCIDDGDAERPCYVVPRTNDIVVGGTAQQGDWNREPDADTARTILDRAEAMVPAIKGARVLRHKVGLRPARPTVRLEAETAAGGGRIVHCYGHGGAGVTLSWGCADEVAALVS
ncbi:FAD-dependent oxidoreductase [Spirillospora sp. NPDC047279]|uniref:NAD(P)/FAD-dependent oxidoreductase n=1 Tax=Spirillospora sp. NPDC047279 TaxID=3155478 RepID=UPI0033F51754